MSEIDLFHVRHSKRVKKRDKIEILICMLNAWYSLSRSLLDLSYVRLVTMQGLPHHDKIYNAVLGSHGLIVSQHLFGSFLSTYMSNPNHHSHICCTIQHEYTDPELSKLIWNPTHRNPLECDLWLWLCIQPLEWHPWDLLCKLWTLVPSSCGSDLWRYKAFSYKIHKIKMQLCTIIIESGYFKVLGISSLWDIQYSN